MIASFFYPYGANRNVKIFIGSDDSETRKEFSELCGNKKIKQFSVNTNAENPASSNTGATTQPLITVGMLERLNGDEKGDAIVSVRGYEPIWTVFTPSYELKKTYFPEGKAAIGKREAVLFEKEKYVFDISGESGQSMEDKINEVIEEREAEKAEMLEKQGAIFHFADHTGLNISSTEIREKVRKGISVKDETGEKVVEIIEKYGLYKN